MATAPSELRPTPRWTSLTCVALAHAWTMTWLAWTLTPVNLQNPNLARWGLPASLAWALLATLGVVVGGALLARAPGRGRRVMNQRGPTLGCGGMAISAAGGAVLLTAGVAAAGALGAASALLAAVAGLAVVFYRLAGRFIPAVAVVGTGVWHAVVMAVPDPGLSYAWPAMLAMTHAVAIAVVARAGEVERPGLSVRGGWAVAVGWAFVALLVSGGMTARGVALLPVTGATGAWLWGAPAVALGLFVVLVAGVMVGAASREVHRRAAARRVVAAGSVWPIVYDAAWLLGAGLWWPGVTVLGLGAACVVPVVLRRWREATRDPADYRLP